MENKEQDKDRQRWEEQRCQVLVIIYSLEEYMNKNGIEKLIELCEEFPSIKKEKKELERSNKQRIFASILNEIFQAQEDDIKNINLKAVMLAILEAAFDAEMEADFNQERWESSIQDYEKELIKQRWDRLKVEEQLRLMNENILLLNNQKEEINRLIDRFTAIKYELIVIAQRKRKTVSVEGKAMADDLYAIVKQYSKLPKELEAKKIILLTELETFSKKPNGSFSDFHNKITKAHNVIKKYILSSGNKHRDADIKHVRRYDDREKIAPILKRIEESAIKDEAMVSVLDKGISRLGKISEYFTQEIEKPSYDLKKIFDAVKEADKTKRSVFEHAKTFIKGIKPKIADRYETSIHSEEFQKELSALKANQENLVMHIEAEFNKAETTSGLNYDDDDSIIEENDTTVNNNRAAESLPDNQTSKPTPQVAAGHGKPDKEKVVTDKDISSKENISESNNIATVGGRASESNRVQNSNNALLSMIKSKVIPKRKPKDDPEQDQGSVNRFKP
jgi:hypothetical protein